MKMFRVEALCGDAKLWEVMRCLEETKCVNILARPIGGEDGVIKSNGKHADNPREGSMIDTVLNIVRNADAPIKASDIKAALTAAYGRPVIKPHGMLFVLKKRKLIRTVGGGCYVATKREAA